MMAKKAWTDAEKQAFGEKMKAARAAKKQSEQIHETPPKMESSQDIGDLLKQIAELKDNPLIQALFNGGASQAPVGPQVTSRGLIGTLEKYNVNPDYYPSPVDRLMDEPRLQRFAFKDNYEIHYEVQLSEYETKDGINQREPRFYIELNRIVYDEDTGEPTTGRYTVCKGYWHEDPQSAIVVARENGLPVDENNEKQFLDEMRYLQMRNWLFEAFYPPVSDVKHKNKTEKVIGNKLVDFFEVNSETSASIDFSKIAKKL